jgi:hypothetical protein
MITASYWEASEDWGGFQTARIIAQPILHTKKFLRRASKISGMTLRLITAAQFATPAPSNFGRPPSELMKLC